MLQAERNAERLAVFGVLKARTPEGVASFKCQTRRFAVRYALMLYELLRFNVLLPVPLASYVVALPFPLLAGGAGAPPPSGFCLVCAVLYILLHHCYIVPIGTAPNRTPVKYEAFSCVVCSACCSASNRFCVSLSNAFAVPALPCP